MGIEFGSVEEWVFPHMFPKNFLHFLSPPKENFGVKWLIFKECDIYRSEVPMLFWRITLIALPSCRIS